MQVVSFKICPFVQRVNALLEAKQVSYDVKFIDLSNKPAWFLEASPNGQVPILINDDGQVLFESDAIVEYLDETTGEPISAKDPVKKAQDRAWSYLATKHYLVQCSAQRSPDEQALIERQSKLAKAFQKVETQLAKVHFSTVKTTAWSILLGWSYCTERQSSKDALVTIFWPNSPK
jgi:glutathione S-transferase